MNGRTAPPPSHFDFAISHFDFAIYHFDFAIYYFDFAVYCLDFALFYLLLLAGAGRARGAGTAGVPIGAGTAVPSASGFLTSSVTSPIPSVTS